MSSKKAKKEAAKQAAKAKDCAADFAERTGDLVQTGASDLAGKIRKSEVIDKATETANELSDKAGKAWKDSGLEDRAVELAEKVKDSDAAKVASDKTRFYTNAGLASLGGWLASGPAAEKLGIKHRRTWPFWLLAAIGVGIGFVIGRLTAPRPGVDVRNDLASAADRLATKASTVIEDAGNKVDEATEAVSDAVDEAAQTADEAVELATDNIKSALEADDRTKTLPSVDIDVADGTVFVRGEVPVEVDEDALRDVIGKVPGVRDVDVNLTRTA